MPWAKFSPSSPPSKLSRGGQSHVFCHLVRHFSPRLSIFSRQKRSLSVLFHILESFVIGIFYTQLRFYIGSIQILGGVQRLIFKKTSYLEASHLMNSHFFQISYYEWLQNNQMYLEIPSVAISIALASSNLTVPNFGGLKIMIWDIWIINFGYWILFFNML